MFAITGIEVTDTQVTLTWPSLAGNTYEIQYSTNLVDWSKLASGYAAADPGTVTSWSAALDELGGGTGPDGVLALYDAEEGSNGDFNTGAFDSVDSDATTTATRLMQGGSLTGGGAAAFVLANALFDSSDSGSPGFNLADVATASQATAATAGDWFAFTLQSGGNSVTYERIDFFTDQYGSSAKIDVSYRIGVSETFILQDFVPPGGNVAVALQSVDFPDFTTDQEVTWTFYLYGASASNYGTRFDDITLVGTSGATSGDGSAARGFFRIGLLP